MNNGGKIRLIGEEMGFGSKLHAANSGKERTDVLNCRVGTPSFHLGLFVSLICRYVKSGLKGIAPPGGADLAGKL